MAKSRIIKELANNIISLDVALSRLLILASDINNTELSNWAEKELSGYNDNDILPQYRIFHGMPIIYSGINGSFQMTKQPLVLEGLFDSETVDKFQTAEMRDSIVSMNAYLNSDKHSEYTSDLTMLAGTLHKKTGVYYTSIHKIIPNSSVHGILDTLKTKLLKIFIELEKEYGCLDDLDINTDSKTDEEINNTNQIIYNYIFNDNSVNIGDKNKIEESTF